MAIILNPLFASRSAHTFTIVAGGGVNISGTIAWPSIAVDYGNEGSEDDPPTRSYINIEDDTATAVRYGQGDKVAALLPLSAEAIEIDTGDGEGGGVLPQFRRPIAAQKLFIHQQTF